AYKFKDGMASYPVQQVSPSLLADCRMKLQEELEHAEQARSGWGMFIFDFAGWMQQIKLAPALTMALLIIGFAGGAITMWRISRNQAQISGSGHEGPVIANIAGIESVSSQPGSNKIQVKYDVLSPQMYEGSADDPQIQQLLLLGTQNP